MRTTASALLVLALVDTGWAQLETVDLYSVVIDGNTVTVEYSKDFEACAHLYNDKGQITHVQNLFCTSGDHVVSVNELSEFTNLQVGDVVHLQHGNNPNIRSDDVTVTGPPAVALHRVEIDGDSVTVEYSKNFTACAVLYDDAGQPVHDDDLFCVTGEHIVSVHDLADFTSLAAGDVVHLRHANDADIRSEDVTVTELLTVALHRVEIDGDTVTVEYSKNFAACAVLHQDGGEVAHADDLFCGMGDHVVSVHDLTDFTSLDVGDVVYLRHPANPDVRSDDVTVTAAPDECPLEFALRQIQRLVPTRLRGNRRAQLVPENVLTVVRRFRDESLTRTPAGRRLIAAYYGHRGELTRILACRPELAARAVALVLRARPALESCDGALTLDDDLYADGLALLDEVAARASPELQMALAESRADITVTCAREGQGCITRHFNDGLPGGAQLVRAEPPRPSGMPGSAAIVGGAVALAGMGVVRRPRRAAAHRRS